MFERQFLKRFTPDRDGFVYRSWIYGEMRFSRSEVDEFVRLRRRIWSNSGLWALVLALGVAAPVGLLLRGGADAALYAGLCLLPGLFGPALLLLWAETAPASAASDKRVARSKAGAESSEPPSRLARAIHSIWLALFMAYYAYRLVTAQGWFSRAVALVAFLIFAWFLLPERFRPFAAKPRSGL